MQLKGKKIVLGISGSIAAYKSAILTRLLVKNGAEVKVLMTKAAQAFVNPLTFSTLSKNAVLTGVIEDESWNNHVELGLWADALVIAPCTANTLAKLANGICDNIISAVYLSARCPVMLAPAMDVDMWKHPATKRSLQLVKAYQNHVIPVGFGELASGLVGDGRMAEPEDIVDFLQTYFNQDKPLAGKKVLITAGPTYEPIDPVRFIGNRSSGKMGIALAEAARNAGAEVTLVLGPSNLSTEHFHPIKVETAEEMYNAAHQNFAQTDIAILAAAVSDYRPKAIATQKIKKTENEFHIETTKTPDIAASLGKIKKPHQIIVGFALETNNEELNAKTKLQKKNFDFIVLNSLQDKGAGFGYDTNKVKILFKDGKVQEHSLKSKKEVAEDIINAIVSTFQ